MATRLVLTFLFLFSFSFLGCEEAASESDQPTFAEMMATQDQCEAACGNLRAQCGVVSPGCVQACSTNLSVEQRTCIGNATSCEGTESCTTDRRVAEAATPAETATR